MEVSIMTPPQQPDSAARAHSFALTASNLSVRNTASLSPDTPPGISWHQWGEAIDFFWLVDGKAEWSATKLIDGHNGYKTLANEAEKLGLTAGGHWNKFKVWPHIQRPKENNPAKLHLVKEIDTEMHKR